MTKRSLFDSAIVPAVLVSQLIVISLLTACAGSGGQNAMQVRSNSAGLGNATSPIADTARIYRLGTGDRLKVTVFGEPELSGQFEIGAQGSLSMPLIGDIAARGHTTKELKDTIRKLLSDGYIKDPKVTVEVLNYRSFFVHGEVRNSGEFKFKNGLTLRDAIAMAGGYTYRADKSYIYLTRENAMRESVVNLPVRVQVLPGDNLRIPERFF